MYTLEIVENKKSTTLRNLLDQFVAVFPNNDAKIYVAQITPPKNITWLLVNNAQNKIMVDPTGNMTKICHKFADVAGM